MVKPRVCVLRSAGTNCDKETAAAFELAGGRSELLHINSLVNKERALGDFQILALPGGFSYGDDVASGKIFANELRFKLADSLRQFIEDGKLIIGICNGFQILVKSRLLPGCSDMKQEASLIINDSGKFEARWVYLTGKTCLPAGRCVWTKGLKEIIYLPVAHGEGKFVTKDKQVLNRLKKNGQVVFQYCDAKGRPSGYPDNPNGSTENIAGICDETGRVFGLMPHPERHIYASQHPRSWDRSRAGYGDGLQIFKNGIDYIKNKGSFK
ncbi:MAG: phosphoribosylformylglycinamidine synthase I [Candidatus Omnitrophica bacterium]|nr:phosphoribosylformylglycinamidine synthase I [Candidatus Omnitrophota bacterium]